jgi:hypothetical protein
LGRIFPCKAGFQWVAKSCIKKLEVRKGRGKEESLNSMKGRKKELLVYQVDLSQQNAWQQYFLNGPQEKEKKNIEEKKAIPHFQGQYTHH